MDGGDPMVFGNRMCGGDDMGHNGFCKGDRRSIRRMPDEHVDKLGRCSVGFEPLPNGGPFGMTAVVVGPVAGVDAPTGSGGSPRGLVVVVVPRRSDAGR